MRSPFESLADLVNRRPALVAGVTVALLVLMLYGASLTAMETGMSTYVDTDSERGMLLDQYTDTFQSDSVMVLIEADDVLDPEVLSYTSGLMAEFGTIDSVTATSSVADLLAAANGGEVPHSAGDVARSRERLDPRIVSRLVPSPSMTFGMVTLAPGLSSGAKDDILDNMDARIRLSDKPAGVTVTVTGEAAFSQQMMEEMETSMGTLLLAAMLLMVVAVVFFFGDVRYRLLSVGIVATGVIATFGVMGLTGMKISMVVIGAFPVLIGIGIDYAIQFHSRFEEEARRVPLSEAVKITVTRAGPAVAIAMIATSMGFIALWISPVPMIRGFGLVCVIGLACCYLAALVIVPTFGLLVGYRPKRQQEPKPGEQSMMERYNQGVGRVAGWVSRNAVLVLLVLSLVAFVGVQMDNQIIINTDEKTFVPSDMPAKVNLDKVTRALGPTDALPIFVRGEHVLSPEGIAWMAEFQDYIASHNDKITGTMSIATLLRQYNGGTLPATQGELEAVLERIPEETRHRYLGSRSEAIIEVSMVAMENQVAMEQVDRIQEDLDWLAPPPGITARVTGMGEMFTNLIREIQAGKTTMTLLAFGMILVFLLLVYRSLGKAVTPIIPIVMIVGWNGLVMYLLGIDYTPMTATLGSMSIGVASEYTILIMERAYEERAKGKALLPAIQYAVSQIGTAITVSGLTTVFGFAALMLSAFNMISNFGMVTVFSVGFSLIGAIIVMPAVLVLLGGRDGGGKSETRPADPLAG
ncbi:MAG: hydrophobe/amphiphile efflux-3 (HAE3) family transporter [Methanomicrobiales archaeon]|nr:hydrophobe/amphiphile efflux-3 (HAE3) family transporter [Methanomicrobiales archaeon]